LDRTADRYSTAYLNRIADHLYSSVVADILDGLGYRYQVMRPEIRPLYVGARVAGRAATMLVVEVIDVPAKPYRLLMELLDSIKTGEVPVAGVQGRADAAIWGELLSTHTRAHGGRGAVLDGLCRDSRQIAEMRFPVFSTGFSPADSKGRLDVVSIRGTIPVGGVTVADGDLVVADDDGCVVVPSAVEDEAVTEALVKVSGENRVREVLRQGASIRTVFQEHRVL
jgi:4-hydroxy-4-methyl-2-oxoglutarate aldolase